VVLGVVGNILSVVGVVITNKYITEVDGYNFMIFLSFLHFVATTIGTRLLLSVGVFQYKEASFAGVLPVSLGSLLSVAFMNLNLSHNSVGFYQLSKLACIPATLIIQFLAYKASVPTSVQLTLIPITFGVGYTTVYDIDINFVGLVYATLAVLATAMSQIFTNTYQKSLDCNALQLLHHTSPIIGLVCVCVCATLSSLSDACAYARCCVQGMLVLCPVFDDVTALQRHVLTRGCVGRIALSCVFALGVNISNYLVLGKTSPLTYQVLGHVKTVLILVLGFTMFNKPFDIQQGIGITVAMLGVIAYTELQRRRQSAPPAPQHTASASADTRGKP